jgi:hypothetical protein
MDDEKRPFANVRLDLPPELTTRPAARQTDLIDPYSERHHRVDEVTEGERAPL